MKYRSSTVRGFLLTTLFAASAGMAAAPETDRWLIEAVRRGDASTVKALLRDRVPVDAPSGDGSTALHWAAHEENLAVAKQLLAARADVTVTTRLQGLTPLMMACQTGNAAMIELLIKHGANPNQPNAQGTTPLMMAAASGSAKAVDVLVKSGAQVDAREGVRDQTALMFAASLDRADAIRTLIAHGANAELASKVIPATRYERPRNAPMPMEEEDPADAEKNKLEKAKAQAANKGTTAAVLVPVTADERAAAQKRRREREAQQMGGYTALLYAARQGNVAATRALLDGGAKIDQPSGSEQTTPLLFAIHNGHYDVARVLVDRGADVNKVNAMGLAPLYATVDVQWAPHQWSPEPVVAQEQTDYLTLMKLMIDRGADVNARLGRYPWFRTLTQSRTWAETAGSTAFWRAAWALDLKAMELLKAAGADTALPTNDGTTPLMAAAGVGWAANYSTTAASRMEAVKFTLANGGDVTTQDKLGFTALHGAGFVADLELIQFLVDLGAKADVKTKAGDYPADSANGPFEKSLPHPEAVALLEKLGSPNSHNCRSSDCVPPVKEEKPVVAAAAQKKPAG
ncbi:MAG: ankyrin repeat domain-containing protein [Steroidobacteraceae bacterium]